MLSQELRRIAVKIDPNHQCNCENNACEHTKQNKGCPNYASGIKALYIGPICEECSKKYPKEYLKPPYGTAKE